MFKTVVIKNLSLLLHDEAGATAIEYSLVAALIALVIITGVTTLGTNLSAKYVSISNSLP